MLHRKVKNLSLTSFDAWSAVSGLCMDVTILGKRPKWHFYMDSFKKASGAQSYPTLCLAPLKGRQRYQDTSRMQQTAT